MRYIWFKQQFYILFTLIYRASTGLRKSMYACVRERVKGVGR